MAKKKKQILPAWKWAMIVVAILLVFIGLRKWVFPPSFPAAASTYEVFGVDVSKHSGKIKWDKLKDNRVQFAYIKATEGEDYVDPLYKENYKGLRQNNILFGAYHFFRFNRDGRLQALHFIDHADLRPGNLLPVIDVETWGNTLTTRSDKEVIVEIGKFISTIRQQLHVSPIIYTNGESYRRFIKGHYDDCPLWFCDIDDEPRDEVSHWMMWQYSHRGKIEGARHEIDFNVFRRTKGELVRRFTMK